MTRRIYRDHKEKKHSNIEIIKRNNSIFQTLVANDIKEKNALRYRFSDKDFDKGIEWFNSGLSLEDAPEDLRTSGSFIKGFQRGNTIKLINETLYNTGIEYYLKGISLDNIPDKYKNSEFFMSGYNDACNKIKHK